jgi:LysR family hydrogen peroxide-inducible transcriptional activator
MNLRDLDYICALAEQLHFGRAAEQCHVSQPTLSGQIKKLEAELGVTLFERGTKSVRVTQAGEEIIAIAREARDAARRIRMVAATAQDPLAGTLSIGLIPTIAPYLIPRFVGRLPEVLPKIRPIFREDITDRLTDDLMSGALDVAVLATPPENEALIAIPLYAEPFRLILPQGHALAERPSIAMSDVDLDEILLLTEGHCFRDQALSICHPAPSLASQSLRATSLETLINLVASGQGVTLVPELAVREGWAQELGLVSRTLSDASAMREICLTTRRRFPRRDAVQMLAELIRLGLPETVTAQT